MSDSKIKVAIVDDQPLMQQTILEKIAFHSDIQVEYVASEGKEILNYLESNPGLQFDPFGCRNAWNERD